MGFLNAPEPFTEMYTRNFFRATWFLTAMDAGFFTVNFVIYSGYGHKTKMDKRYHVGCIYHSLHAFSRRC
jgi:hypothetical protein